MNCCFTTVSCDIFFMIMFTVNDSNIQIAASCPKHCGVSFHQLCLASKVAQS